MELNSICDFIVDTKHKTPKFETQGIPCIRTPNIGRGYFILDNAKYVSEETYEEWISRAKPSENDLILAREAPVGNVAIIPSGLKVCHGQRTVLIRPNPSKVFPSYLMYLLLGDDIQHKMKSIASGATVAHLNMSDIRALKLPELPSMKSQQKIASILSTYDDLIENNNRRIAILEEMARRLYREWFVKFRFPACEDREADDNCLSSVGSELEAMDEIPPPETKFVDSELGEIPEGWEVVRISDLYKTSSGGTPSRKKPEYFENADIQWVKTKELKDSFVIQSEENISELGLKNSSAKLFPKHSVLMAMYGATIGQLGIISQESSSNQACCALIPQDESFSPWYVFLYLLANRTHIIGQRMGAAQQNISQQIIKEFTILKPITEIMNIFNQLVQPMFLQMETLQKKNRNLKQQRDLLLPKLISGKLNV